MSPITIRLSSRLAAPLLAFWTSGAVALGPDGNLGSKFLVNDEAPTSNIPSEEERNEDPVEFGYFLQDLTARGQQAMLDAEWESAAGYFEALALAVPQAGVSFEKLCTIYQAMGQTEKAADSCFEVLTRENARVLDHSRFISAVLRKDRLDETDRENVETSLSHLREHAANPARNLSNQEERNAVQRLQAKMLADSDAPQKPKAETSDGSNEQPGDAVSPETQVEILACKYAARIGDQDALAKCVTTLGKAGNDPRLALPFAWSLALIDEDKEAAEALLTRAASFGVKPGAIARMREQFAKGPRVEAPAKDVTAETDEIGVSEPDAPPQSPAAGLALDAAAAPSSGGSRRLGLWLVALGVAVGLGLLAFFRQRRRAEA